MTKFCSTSILFVLLLLIPFFSVHPEIKISSVEITGDAPNNLVEKIRHYIPFAPDTPVTDEQIRETVNGIKNLNLFKNVQYTLSPSTQGNYTLEISLNQAPKIRNISVQGNYPLLGKNITKLIPLQPGSVFDESRIPESVQLIEKFLTKQGYYNSSVSLQSKPANKYNAVDLKIVIKKGLKYRIGKVTVSGNQAFRTSRIKNKIQHWSHFKPVRLQKDIKNIEKMYINNGFVKARAEAHNIVFHDDTQTVDLTITIEENKHLTLCIDGKPLLWRSSIKDVIALKDRRSYDRYAISQSRERLENYYQKKGFPNPLIETEVLKPDEAHVIAHYTILPGKRVELREIKFDGNDKIGGKKLKKNLRSRESAILSPGYFYEDFLNQDRERVEQTYLEKGFFDAQVDLPHFKSNLQGDHRTAIYPVNEGSQYHISSVTIRSNDAADQPLLIKKTNLSTGKAFNAEKLNKAKTRLLEYLQSQGFAYATITPVLDKNSTDHTVAIIFEVTTGVEVQVRSITLDGTMITRPNTILNNIKIRTGDPFVYQKLLDAQMNLRKMGLFSSVQITPLGFEAQSDRIDLLVGVTEHKSFEVDVRGGFDSRYWATGEVSLTKHNIFGTGRQINARAIAGPEYDRGEFTFFSPRVFGASWNLANQYFWEYEDEPYYNASSYGSFVSTLKKFGNHVTFGFREQVSRTDLYESESDVDALGDSIYDNTLNEFQLNVIFDTRNNYADPSRGFYILARDEINTDIIDPSNNFNILEVNASHFQGFLKRFTLINTARFGHILDIAGSPIIPANKLFFLGGADTLRGFDEDAVNPSGGTAFMLYNAELQLRMTNSVKLAGFFDAGTLTDHITTVDWSDFREAAGFGLRYVTPIGPLRLDWAFILDRQDSEPTNHFHFSFGYYF